MKRISSAAIGFAVVLSSGGGSSRPVRSGIYRRTNTCARCASGTRAEPEQRSAPGANERAPGEEDRWSDERSPYEDLGLPTGGEQANRPEGRTPRPGEFQSGGSFACPQVGPPARARVADPEQTGALRRGGAAF
jgi:hypothetical protein